jgi:hypothetical protein
MGMKYPSIWGALACANAWLAHGDTWPGVAFIALATAMLFLVKEPRHD